MQSILFIVIHEIDHIYWGINPIILILMKICMHVKV